MFFPRKSRDEDFSPTLFGEDDIGEGGERSTHIFLSLLRNLLHLPLKLFSTLYSSHLDEPIDPSRYDLPLVKVVVSSRNLDGFSAPYTGLHLHELRFGRVLLGELCTHYVEGVILKVPVFRGHHSRLLLWETALTYHTVREALVSFRRDADATEATIGYEMSKEEAQLFWRHRSTDRLMKWCDTEGLRVKPSYQDGKLSLSLHKEHQAEGFEIRGTEHTPASLATLKKTPLRLVV